MVTILNISGMVEVYLYTLVKNQNLLLVLLSFLKICVKIETQDECKAVQF
jgi:hypothetical protein